MAATGLEIKKYLNLWRKLLPQGHAWESKNDSDSDFNILLKSLSSEPCRIDQRANELINEVYPDTTLELLEDWERLLALPDECSPDEELSVQERRDRVIQVLTTRGGQNSAFYQTLAANFGFDVDIIEVKDQPPFRAGQARAGDRLTNGGWRFAFIVSAPSDSVVRFRAGQSTAGDPLLKVTNTTLECLMEKYKPAHTEVIFSFGDF
jgi:uncharacterized protein YmfQ (DUF2313 family)